KVETELMEIVYRLKWALVEGQRAADAHAQPRKLKDEIDSGAQTIHEKLLQLERARRERDAVLAAYEREMTALSKTTELSIEVIVVTAIAKTIGGLEAHLKYDVTLLATIEAIRKAGLDPATYNLPSFDDALQRFSYRSVTHSTYQQMVEQIQSNLEELARPSAGTAPSIAKQESQPVSDLDLDEAIARFIKEHGDRPKYPASEDLLDLYEKRARV